jgi:hypothetical protein
MISCTCVLDVSLYDPNRSEYVTTRLQIDRLLQHDVAEARNVSSSILIHNVLVYVHLNKSR